jgi:cyclopropane-fatty-acyl-phospholipid synthase
MQLPKTSVKNLSNKLHENSVEAIAFHFDVSNQFYQLWLDKHMVYSCSYFKTPEKSLAEAQCDKLDYICRKLRLQAGEYLLDIGCGWGAHVCWAAKHYGAKLKHTFGENLVCVCWSR